MKNTEGHPRMLGISVMSGALALIMIVLVCRDAASDHAIQDPFTTLVLIGLLVAASVASFRLHRRLRIMSPDERDAYWSRLESRVDKDRRDPPFGGLG